jgi:hypothetical protein
MGVRFRLVIYDTNYDNKYAADSRYEFLGSRDSIWFLWYQLTAVEGKKHVEVFNLAGSKQRPEDGINGMSDISV